MITVEAVLVPHCPGKPVLPVSGHRQRIDVFTGSVIGQELPSHVFKVRKVILTPTRRIYMPPQFVCKSRLLQHFDPDYAPRIIVRDDDCKLVFFSLVACKDDFLSAVIKPPLSSGLNIAGSRFMLLGCSTSQLCNHGVWFYAHDNQGRTAEQIRDGIGDLSTILSVAKFMARLGQAFSQPLGLLTVPSQNTSVEPDIRHAAPGCRSDSSHREYIFSDSIGRISPGLLRKHRPQQAPRDTHSSRGSLQGSSPTSLRLRSDGVLYLNRPMITILEQSGIKAEVFLMLQNKILNSFIDKMMDPHEAAHVLCVYCALRLPYKERACGCIDLTIEPFFRALVRAVNKKVLKELRTKARILVLSDYGLTMFGVLDETGTLEYGQVFVQYSNDRHATVQGDVIVTKSPCMHTGDIPQLKAVNVPQLHHVRDCTVFPQKGERPLPRRDDRYAPFLASALC
ncbi:uncharacterized protein LOC144122481 [Amblyomma americanum]